MSRFVYLMLSVSVLLSGCATMRPTTANAQLNTEGVRTPANDRVLPYSPSRNFKSPVLLLTKLSDSSLAFQEAMSQVISAAGEHARYCFEKNLAGARAADGSHVFYFTVYPNGKVADVVIESQQDGDEVRSFDLCITQMLEGLKAPTSSSAHVFRWKVSTQVQ